MSVTDEQIPETYIDLERAREIAYASKEQRCLAAAGRLADSILEANLSDETTAGLVRDAVIAGELFEAYEVYPEMFRRFSFGTLKSSVDQRTILGAVPQIIKLGGLPVKEVHSRVVKIGEDELDAEAEVREQIAAALLDTPPNQVFMDEFDLRDLRHKKDPVQLVYALVDDWVPGLTDRAQKHRTKTTDDLRHYESENKDASSPIRSSKMQKMIYMLEATWGELETHFKDNDFKDEVFKAYDNENTSLGDLKELWLRGRSLIVDCYTQEAAKKQQAYDMILSGEAATYEGEASE